MRYTRESINIRRYNMDKKRICPRCGKEYTGYPALSRKDNETPICSDCGMEEALESMGDLGGGIPVTEDK
jgi:predicted RNA-binding Zn-ribbon protein involved in translation (DUF1610 family)